MNCVNIYLAKNLCPVSYLFNIKKPTFDTITYIYNIKLRYLLEA